MNLKGLVHRELGEGMTEKELAEAVGVPLRTLTNILAGRNPRDRAVWDKFARYFRMDVDFLRTGDPAHARRMVELPGNTRHSAAGEIRQIPLLQWQEIGQIATSKNLPGVLHAEAVVEATDVSGARTIALKVQDDSMEPLFSQGEMIFVNPDLEWKPGDYVIAATRDHDSETVLLRQVKRMGSQHILHPLNRKYEDVPVTDRNAVWGKVVRLRKNL
ncbi:MAG TPA: LexA family transcriptional regulator [Nitrospira sp.]|nr:LexA family transcriptional regulator [Nitrospira sp.]